MCNSLGEYNQAKELDKKALMISKKIFGEDNAYVATSYDNLASVYNSLGEFNQAKKLTKKHWRFAKGFLAKVMPMQQQVMTTWH